MQSKTTPAEPERSNERATSRAVAGSLKPIALDGHPEVAGSRDLADALAEFAAYGGNDRALLFELKRGRVTQDLARFRREQAAAERDRTLPTPNARRAEERLLVAALAAVVKLHTGARHAAMKTAAADALVALSDGGHRVAIDRAYFSASGLKAQRVAAAQDDASRRRHTQLPAGAPKRAVEPYHRRAVVRTVLAHVARIKPAIRKEVRADLREIRRSRREDQLVSEHVNRLTARIAAGFLISTGLAGDITAKFVSDVRADDLRHVHRSDARTPAVPTRR
jgi:hypothetical protein